MKVTCPKCAAVVELDPDGNELDLIYKLTCPVIDRELLKSGGTAENIECPHMRQAKAKAILAARHPK